MRTGARGRGTRFERLAAACREAGCTRRQTEVVLGTADGESNAEIASSLGIRQQAVEQTLRAGIRKLERLFPARQGMNRATARDLLKCFENKRSYRRHPEPAVYDLDGRRVASSAKPFGMSADDLARDPRGSTQVVLELVCRIAGAAVPPLRLRKEEVNQTGDAASSGSGEVRPVEA